MSHYSTIVFVIAVFLWGIPVCVAKPPNVIVIIVDDMGYEGISCFGNQYFQTPGIDQLAAEGIKLTDFHATAAVCSPSRAAVMTGRYQHRAGIPKVINAEPDHPDHNRGISSEHWTFAEAMKGAGYATAIFGKWHLGYRAACNPVHHGFDRFVGFNSGSVDYHSHINRTGQFDWSHGETSTHEEGYQTDLITKHTLEFITENRGDPFFAYVSFGCPHSPHQARSSKIQKGKNRGKVPNYAPDVELSDTPGDDSWVIRHMVLAVDEGVAAIRNTVHELGIADNTIIWFFSDNGGTRGDRGNLTTGDSIRGEKGSMYEGGHRVPAIAWAPGRITPGTQSAEILSTMDIMATSIALAGIALPKKEPLDGVNISSHLFANAPVVKRHFFWAAAPNRWAARDGKWKAVRLRGKVELYDLDADLAEKHDLAAQYPERVSALSSAATEWFSDVTDGTEPLIVQGSSSKRRKPKTKTKQ